MLSIFISYSHKDKELQSELKKHLAGLRRNSAIKVWYDGCIGPGKEIDGEIDTQLAAANIILLLVSADFLDSDYCYEIEMSRAMDRHKKGTARVIPVILRPCDWKSTPFGRLLVSTPNGKPIVKYETRDDGFLAVVQAVHHAVEELSEATALNEKSNNEAASHSKSQQSLRSGNLRGAREFTDDERENYINNAFDFICLYFEHSLQGLKARNIGLETSDVRFDDCHFAARALGENFGVSQCDIWLIEDAESNLIIRYNNGIATTDGSNLVSMSVGADGYFLFLGPYGAVQVEQTQDIKYTSKEAAEYFWSLFVVRLTL